MRGNSKSPRRRAEKNRASHAGVRKTGRHIKMKKFADFEYDASEERIFKTRVVNISKTSRMSATALKKKKLEVVHSSPKKRTARPTRMTSNHVTQDSQKCLDISKTKAKASRQGTKLSSTEDTDETSKAVAKTDKNKSDVEGKIEDCIDEVEVKAGDLKNESPRTAGAALSRVKRNLKRKKNLKKGRNNTDTSVQSSEQVFNCNDCDEVVVGKDNFNKHKKTHKQAKKVFRCLFEGCTKEFRDSSNLRKHENSVHLNIRKFLCEFCVAQFKTSSSLKTHIAAYHTRKEDREQFTCNICNKTFLRKVSLTQHASLHTNVKNHTCSYEGCGKSFRLKETLTKHIRALHKDEKPYECNICWEKFSRKTYLETHMYKHTGIKKFSCEVCGKFFSQKGNLKVHMLLHNKERPVFKCPDCSQTFNFKSNLTKHQQTKHLLNVLKIEEGEPGEVSNEGTKKFSCEVCGKYFSQKGNLKVHMLLHNKERPVFKCPQCFQTFSFNSNLIKHQQTKHQAYIWKLEGEEAEGSNTSTILEENMNKDTDDKKIQQEQSSDREAYTAIDLSNKRKISETEKEMGSIKAPHKILVTSAVERNKKSIIIVVKHFNDSNNDFCGKPLEEINHESVNVEKDENEVKSSPIVLVTAKQSSNGHVTESNEIFNHVTLEKETELNNDRSEISFQVGKSDNEKVYPNIDSALNDSDPKVEVTTSNNDVLAHKSVLAILPEEFLSSDSTADSVAEKNENNTTSDRNVNCAVSKGTGAIVNEARYDGSGRDTDSNVQNSEMMASDNVVYKETNPLTLQHSEGADVKANNSRVQGAEQASDLDIKMDTSGVSDSNKSIKVQTLKNPEYFDINELIVKEQVESEIPVENF